MDIHRAILAELRKEQIAHQHEYVLGPGCRVDIMTEGGVAIEVKKGKPNAARVRAQIDRYAAHDVVRGIIVVVERNLHTYPQSARSKPVAYVSLNKNWGLSL